MDPTEHDLVNRSAEGDHAAFARLIDLHRTPALRVAYAIAGDEAEDAVQVACLQAYTVLDGFDRDRAFRPWFLTMVTDEARNRNRSAGPEALLALRVAGPAAAGAGGATDLADGAADEPARPTTRRALAEAVGRLPERDREVIGLRYFAGLTEAETAAVLACPAGTVTSRLAGALARLRSTLTPGAPAGTGTGADDDEATP